MKMLFISLPAIIILICASCSETDINYSDLNTYSITYQRMSSWTNYMYDARFFYDGTLIIEETNELGELLRISEYKISEIDIYLLRESLKNLMPLNISDQYGFTGENLPTDLPVRKIKYTTNNKVDSTLIYYPSENEIPKELDSLLVLSEKLLLENDTTLHE